jgi:broad specificity phosphatase PhoE
MKKLYFLRHGESEHNLWISNPEFDNTLYENIHDYGLTDTGKEQAIVAGRSFDSSQIDMIYCSPLLRARETLQLFSSASELCGEVIYDDRLKEYTMGKEHEFIRLHRKQQNEMYLGDHRKDQMELLFDYRPFNGEYFSDFEERVQSFIDDIQKLNYKNILISAHAGVIRCVHKILLGHISPTIHRHISIKNASISEFILEQK